MPTAWFDKLIYIWRNGINKSLTKFHFYANFAAVKRYYIAWRRSYSRMPSHIPFKWLWRYTLEVYNFYEAGIEPLLCTAFQRALIECSRRKRCYTTFTFRHFRGQRLATHKLWNYANYAEDRKQCPGKNVMASQEMFFVSEIFYHKERARLVHCSFDKSMLYALVGTPLRLELERERNTSSSTQKVVHPFNLPSGQKRHSFAHLLLPTMPCHILKLRRACH